MLLQNQEIDYNRVIMIRDVHFADGRLKAEGGAIGTIRARDEGFVCILFDSGQSAYVEPAGCKTLNQEVPFLDCRPVLLASWNPVRHQVS